MLTLNIILDLLYFKDKISFHINDSIILLAFLWQTALYFIIFSETEIEHRDSAIRTQLVGLAHSIAFPMNFSDVRYDFQFDSLHRSNQPLELMPLHANGKTMNKHCFPNSILQINSGDKYFRFFFFDVLFSASSTFLRARFFFSILFTFFFC